MGESICVYRILVERTEGKRPFKRFRSRWENNTKVELQELGYGVWTGSS
jgi:hypothetical protein